MVALGRVENEVVPTPNVTDSGGGVVATYTYAYDYDGDLIAVTDPNDHTTTYVYNALNEETSTRTPMATPQATRTTAMATS